MLLRIQKKTGKKQGVILKVTFIYSIYFQTVVSKAKLRRNVIIEKYNKSNVNFTILIIISPIKSIITLPMHEISNIEDKNSTQDSSSTHLRASKSVAGNYELINLIQSGGQARAFLALRNQEYFAIKIYHSSDRHHRAFLREVSIIHRLSWPGLISLIETMEQGLFQWREQPQNLKDMIVMQYAAGGDLLNWIDRYGSMEEEAIKHSLKGLLGTLRYVWSHGVAHRDLKPQNILMADNFQLLLTDFGLSTKFTDRESHFGGDTHYSAPEVFKKVEYTEKSQIYSLGIVLYFMAMGELPYSTARINDPNYRLLFERKYNHFWLKTQKKKNFILSKEFKDIFVAMTIPNPENRLNMEELLQMSWFRTKEWTSSKYSQYMGNMMLKTTNIQ